MRKIPYDPSRISLYHPEAGEPIRRALRHVGFSEVSLFDQRDSDAFGALNSNISTVVVAFRGTEQDPTDISTDLRELPKNWPNGGRVHQGFYEAFHRIWPEIDSWIETHPGR